MLAFAATPTQHTGPAQPPRESVWEFIDGGGGESARVVGELDDIGWSGVSVRDVLEVSPNLYAEYWKGLWYRDEDKRWREAYPKLRDEHAGLTSGGIVGANRHMLRDELDSLQNELAGNRSTTVELRRDLKGAQKARDVAQAVAADHDSAVIKVNGQLLGFRGGLNDQGTLAWNRDDFLKEGTTAGKKRPRELKYAQAMLVEQQCKLLLERNRTIAGH